MEEIKEKIEQDMIYYKSGIKQLYMRSYQRYLILIVGVMLMTIIGLGLVSFMMKGLLTIIFLAEIGILIYLLPYLKAEAFEQYFQKMTAQVQHDFQKMERIEIQEDNQSYYFLDENEFFVKLKKKDTRNFPSKISQYTLLVGFTPELGKDLLEQPLQFFYYDITRITLSENYKKEALKNVNFIAKRNRNRVRTALIVLGIIILVSIILYFN